MNKYSLTYIILKPLFSFVPLTCTSFVIRTRGIVCLFHLANYEVVCKCRRSPQWMNEWRRLVFLHTVPCGPLATRVAASFFMALAFKNKILLIAFPPSTRRKGGKRNQLWNTNVRDYFGVGIDQSHAGKTIELTVSWRKILSVLSGSAGWKYVAEDMPWNLIPDDYL